MKSSSIVFSSKGYVGMVMVVVMAFFIISDLTIRYTIVPYHSHLDVLRKTISPDSQNVLVGDSHIVAAFGHDFPGYITLARSQLTTPAMELLVRRYFTAIKPGKVIVIAAPQIFSPRRDQLGAWYFDDMLNHGVHLPGRLFYVNNASMQRLLGLQLTDLWRARVGPDVVAAEKISVKVPVKINSRVVSKVEGHRPVVNYQQSDSYVAYINMLSFLSERGADICMLRTPLDSAYQAQESRDAFHQQAVANFPVIANRFNARFVDFSRLDLALSADHFYDADHMNVTGRVAFSSVLEQACFGVKGTVSESSPHVLDELLSVFVTAN